jgi:hypothetical protein
MESNPVVLAATIILLFPMSYFLLSSPAFLLVRLDIAEVSQLLRGHFHAHFLMVSIAGSVASIAYASAGRPVFAICVGLIAAFSVCARRWFLRRIDRQISARDTGEADANSRLRRLHWSGMLSNALQVAAIVGSIPFIT